MKKALESPEGVAELSVFYCESCADLLGYCGVEDEGDFSALVSMYEQALIVIVDLSVEQQADFLQRLEQIRYVAGDWGVCDDMGDLLEEYEIE
ncbi:MAG: hypothetical protein HN661_14625 [Gammaproteobacteria bacterium]|nr:hypothetical protein [Gammaproteobacteria bacterium]